MRKNILLFGHSYATQFIDISNQYTKLFDKNKFCVTVVYLVGKEDETIRMQHAAEEVIFLDSPKRSVRGLKIDAIKKIWQLQRIKKFEIVICHRFKPSYVMLWIAQVCRFKILFFVMHELGTFSSYTRKILSAILAKKNMIFAGVSNAVRDDLKKTMWGIPTNRMVTLYNMIDVEYTENHFLDRITARQKFKVSPDEFVFGTIGRLAINKDQKTLIDAFSKIKLTCPKAKLIIIGDGQLEQDLKAQVSLLGLNEDIIFTGFISNGFRYLKAFDVFVLSSIQEAFGRVLLEAMIAKIPIIATAVNGIPEVIGETGTLVKAGDQKMLAEVMHQYYQYSSTQLSDNGQLCYERALNHFSLEQFNEIFWQFEKLHSIKETL